MWKSHEKTLCSLAPESIGRKPPCVQADVLGLRKKEVNVKHKNDTWHQVKRSSGKFLRRFRLPENAKLDQIYTAMENGFLTIIIPKEDVKKPDIKTIEISG
ncbi:hypothetical protein FEM48_Zijuj04G0067200 [Ziziphus jujuba var. spinosa]|uniref:SHSP domain-containing protein n=1 Tax=Ziziphus jujuba var. spinosa TaxID=714518 RepID=A0A978VID9_ZIZJJ|nr:hypothetical protein FEM48_Zijuj04G0067200 [Ziziphus jujuba var. spinosa]